MSKDELKKIHLIGIGGSGMTPLAEIAMYQGIEVYGSDQNINRNCKRLVDSGATIKQGHHQDHLSHNLDAVVYSSAISKNNPELIAAKNLGVPLLHRSELLKLLIGEKKLIGVAGTHGKTSTTAMISHMLHECGYKPTAFIGGELTNRNSYAYLGDGEYFVAELDESDGSFLNFSPFISVVNNIDLDHMDYYENFESVKDAYRKFIAATDIDGLTVLNWDNEACHEIGLEIDQCQRLAFGKRIGCDIRGISHRSEEDHCIFKAVVERDLISGQAKLIGDHNFYNILCTLSVAQALEIPLDQAAHSLATYPGVARRLNCLYYDDHYKVFDDYAHNPGKISACIEAVSKSHPGSHICILFQPHRYSRMKTMYNEFTESFINADTVMLLPIFSAGEEGHFDATQFALDLESICDTRTHVMSEGATVEQILDTVKDEPRVVFLSVGAGDVYLTSFQLRDYLNGQKDEKESP